MRNPALLPGLVLGAAAALAACSQTSSRQEPVPGESGGPVTATTPELAAADATRRALIERDDSVSPREAEAASQPGDKLKAEPPKAEPRSAPSSTDEVVSDGRASAAAPVSVAPYEKSAKETKRLAEFGVAKPAVTGAIAQGAVANRVLIAPAPPPAPGLVPKDENRENYAVIDPNPIQRSIEHPVSTFSVDVDTSSYANVRRYLTQGQLPPQDAVRVEELINNFDYAYKVPQERGQPFSVTTEIAPTPWNAKTHLLHVGIQGWKPETKPVGTNLVFLVDVSGSMEDPDKLPLVKSALKMLLGELTSKDRISLVVYAGASGVVLEPTPGNERAKISAALDRLSAGGSTNGGEGIQLAYAMARKGWIEGGVNRVLLATDGDFNVGVTRFESLLDIVKNERKSGIALTTLGFGQGNYNDHLMEQLADVGDGNNAYIDSVQEAHKVLVRQRDATLTTIARDVKIQIEFNPAQVAEYRLIGYENRMLAREDFNNDAVDAGDIGAGHTVTALYEIALTGSGGESVQPLRYAPSHKIENRGGELAHLRLRYKRPDDGTNATSRLIERPLLKSEIKTDVAQASDALRLSASVAAFGQLLSGGVHMKGFDYTSIERLARNVGDDPYGDRAGFRQLVKLAGTLSGQAKGEGAQIGG
ncbi:Ca-activated chloride channel family protein [Panacagrimonas perspica]|uniref:Ca-activated chloride channel family protein n=1 Tax=Panacagrimonas perspica TaxID=381431 RepID=A0A4R7PE46_9GAMM|nr:VWA domain-containing protein [Panacagrimonas perspica]TDU32475.1 Ca-activated chloride channel family protein [Panacagrimonas perspica]